jgi:hypothetical protein
LLVRLAHRHHRLIFLLGGGTTIVLLPLHDDTTDILFGDLVWLTGVTMATGLDTNLGANFVDGLETLLAISFLSDQAANGDIVLICQ